MTEIVNWKKQRIERFKKENLRENDGFKKDNTRNNEGPEKYWTFPEKQKEECINDISLLPENTQIIHPNCSVVNVYQFPNLHITSTTDDKKLIQQRNVPVEAYYPFQKEPTGSKELLKLQKLKDIEISTVSSSDIPREHTPSLAPELDREYTSRLSPELASNQVQTDVLSSVSCTSKTSSLDTTAYQAPRSEPLPTIDHGSREVKSQQKPRRSNVRKAIRAPRKRKPLMDDKSKALLEKAEVKEEYALECLYGDNIDKFRELVTLVAVQNKMGDDEVKVILSNNRRRVKNRGSARRSRVSKNDRLQYLRDERDKLRKRVNLVKDLVQKLQKLKDKVERWKKLFNKAGMIPMAMKNMNNPPLLERILPEKRF